MRGEAAWNGPWLALVAAATCSCGGAARARSPGLAARAAESPARCASCHPGKDADALTGPHLSAGAGCWGCHDPRGHPPEVGLPIREKTPLAPAALRAVEGTCRACDHGPARGADLTKGFLHWRHKARDGLYGGGKQPCTDCHGHGPTGGAAR